MQKCRNYQHSRKKQKPTKNKIVQSDKLLSFLSNDKNLSTSTTKSIPLEPKPTFPTTNVHQNVSSVVAEPEESTESLESISLIDKIRVKDPKTTIINKLNIINLYIKYFSKKVQDTIVVIADILIIIHSSEKYHKRQLDELFEKKNEDAILKCIRNKNRLHTIHYNILKSEFIASFLSVLTLFVESDFELAFKMFFLGILTILREHPKFKTQNLFKNLVSLLCFCLESSDLKHSKSFAILNSESFRSDCIEIISIIEASEDDYQMKFFFTTSDNSWEYFQNVFDVIAGDSRGDLKILIKNALYLCHKNSKFKDPLVYTCMCAERKMDVIQTPVTFNQNISRIDDEVQWVSTTQLPNRIVQ